MIDQKIPILIGVLFFTTIITMPAQNRRHADDTNNDGRISRSEWRGNMSEFRRLDSNRDGFLSGTEIPSDSLDDPGDQSRTPQRQSTSEEVRKLDKNVSGVIEGHEWPYNPQVFHQLDTDRNSVLSTDELKNIQSVTLRELDRNGDGRLDANEWPGGYVEFDRLDANGDGKIAANEYTQRGGELQRSQRFDAWDTNRNGVIESNEWQAAPNLFRRLDTNGDGKVSLQEFRADTNRYRPPYDWR